MQNKQNEIDLVDLLHSLWDKKHWIMLWAMIGAALAGVYAFTAKEQWTSKAEVIEPRLSDVGEYLKLRKEYARILNRKDFNEVALVNNLFNKFNLLTESLDERRAFFSESEIYKTLSKNKSEKEQSILLSNLISKDINVIKPDPKKEANLMGRRITFVAETPKQAQDTLGQFIAFANSSAYKFELDNFLIELNEIISDLNYEKNKFDRELNIQRTVQLGNLNNALKIAKEAGIKEYANSSNILNEAVMVQSIALAENKTLLSDSKLSDGTYLFMLGENYLKAQIDAISNNEIVYPPRYYQIIQLLTELETIRNKIPDTNVNLFKYQASPDYPVLRDQPKKAIILSIGLLLGLVLSSLVILVVNAMRRK